MNEKNIVSQMTLEEKASLLSGEGNFHTKTVSRLGIPSMVLSDGPHGLRKQAGSADHLGLNASQPATCYPTAATIANAWDPSLGEQLGQHLGAEAVEQGISVVLGPGLNIKRSPLCGRNFEYFSEDPYLAGKLAAAYIRGIQSCGVAACPKHFAVNNQELLRMHSDSVLDERTLHEIYLTGFEIAVKEGKPLAIMSSYNRINGTYANESKWLLRDTLVDNWGFDGMVVTDWGGSDHRVAGLIAGSHLEMPATNGESDREIVAAVRAGKLEEAWVDTMVEEYLRVLYATAIPTNPPKTDIDSSHAFVREAAGRSIVLLKNEEDILPLRSGTKVAVIGDFADKPRYQGFGSSVVNPTRVDSPLASFADSGLTLAGYSAGFLRHGGADLPKQTEAVALASKADVVLLYLGLDELAESEGLDRSHLHIRQNQQELITAVAAVNPNLVVVLAGGAPIEMPWFDHCKGMVHGYLGGQAGAGAMVDVLTGRLCPSGKLAESWPISWDDTAIHSYYPGKETTAEYREGLFVGYRYYSTANVPVRFPFGFGLSYTSFDYTDMTASTSEVSFTLTNTGTVAGSEVAQLYVTADDSRLFRARRELKGFAKVELAPGESRRVTIPLDDKAFRYYNVTTGGFAVEGGSYTIAVGASCEDIRIRAVVQVAGTGAPNPYDRSKLECYYTGQVSTVGDRAFSTLIGRAIPPANWDRSKPLGRNDTFAQLFYARGWVGQLVYKILLRQNSLAERKGQPDLNILFIFNEPFRGVAKLTMGMVSLEMVDGLIAIFNGSFFGGMGKLIGGWIRKGRQSRDTKRKLASAGKGEAT